MSEELRALSEGATEGPWEAGRMSNRRAHAIRVRDHHVALYLTRPGDAAFIVRVVNDLRDGLLVPVGPLRELVGRYAVLQDMQVPAYRVVNDLRALLDRLTTPTAEEADR